MAVPMQHPTRGQVAVVNQAVALSRTPCVLDRPTPELGEHTERCWARSATARTTSPAERGKVV